MDRRERHAATMRAYRAAMKPCPGDCGRMSAFFPADGVCADCVYQRRIAELEALCSMALTEGLAGATTLREALARYGRHAWNCMGGQRSPRGHGFPCTCGFAEAAGMAQGA